MKIYPNDPAFPYAAEWGYKPGLSIRAEIASRFMAAIIGSDNGLKTIQKLASGEGTNSMSYLAEVAIDLTDALIAELNKEQSH
jgi:hypothetical protein